MLLSLTISFEASIYIAVVLPLTIIVSISAFYAVHIFYNSNDFKLYGKPLL